MPEIEKYISKSKLDTAYLSAKIIATPYDYTLSDRILIRSRMDIIDSYNIFKKQNNTEVYLAGCLSLDYTKTYLTINVPFTVPIIGLGPLDKLYGETSACSTANQVMGSFIKYNNLVIDEYTLLKNFAYLKEVPMCLAKINIDSLVNENYLKALTVWYLKGIGKDSLIPSLFYLTTNMDTYTLTDLDNMKMAEDCMSSGVAPIIQGFNNNTNFTFGDVLMFNYPIVPSNFMAATGFIYPSNKDFFKSLKEVNDSSLKMGICYAILYGVELLYYFNNIKETTVKEKLTELLKLTFLENSFCDKYLYSFNDSDELVIHPEVSACFNDNPEIRFENIKHFYKNMLKTAFVSDDIKSNLILYGLPVFFADMITAMHTYAYQQLRIRHAIFIYKKAKDAGVINKEDFINTCNNSGVFPSPGTSGTSEYTDNELLDLCNEASDILESSPGFEEREKIVNETKDKFQPSLNAMDILKKDLKDSRYEYDICYVKHDRKLKPAYDTIANNIKMLSHTLTRQIKEIKTYNTGGKQNGLTVGKLDKKNIWRYKTNPKIFCNNNYKLKEMDLAFGCILDESGSMSGEKIKNGRITMVLLHEVLSSLGINHSIIGHTGSGMYQSQIFKYYQFREEDHYSLDKPYGLVQADARSCNCDSGALYYMQSVMKHVRNKDKIVIIFSDGQPTECTELDLVTQVKAMEKSGIHVIGVGINFEAITEYYPDNANGKNLKEMVDIIVSILKRYVLEKKEA